MSTKSTKKPRVLERARGYMFTVNNYSDDDCKNFKLMEESRRPVVAYGIFGRELAPTTGTPHLQCYIYFKNPSTLSAAEKFIHKYIPTAANIQKCDGNARANFEYCSKDEDYEEIGEIPRQGTRTDCNRTKELIISGECGTIDELINHPDFVCNLQNLKLGENLLKYYGRKRRLNDMPNIIYAFGKTGLGKTKEFYRWIDEINKPYYVLTIKKWWEGYKGEEFICINELRGEDLPWNDLLDLLDRYEHRVNVKSTSQQCLGHTFYITSALNPVEVFRGFLKDNDDIDQFLRRIKECREYTDKDVYKVVDPYSYKNTSYSIF